MEVVESWEFLLYFGWIWLVYCTALACLRHAGWLDSRSSLVLLCPSSGSLCPTNCKVTENALTLFLM